MLLIGMFFSLSSSVNAQIQLANTRELFIDNYLIESSQNIENKIGAPVSGGVAIKFEKPWEGRFSGAYVSVVFDGNHHKMYYRGTGLSNDIFKQVTCYAESKDGITWNKPNLNQFKVGDYTSNNIVLLGDELQASHNFSVIYDNRPGVPQTERYKAVGGVASTSKRIKRGLYRYISADGIHWALKDSIPLFTEGYAMDSQNVLAWLPFENQYAIYLRTWTQDKPGDGKLLKGVRTISRSVSKDFINWSKPKEMSFGNAPVEDLYTNATQPYYRAPQILISMPFRFSPESRVLDDAEMLEYDIDKTMWKGVSDAVFMTSRGGYNYDRTFLESYVRPGLDQANWAARSTIPALGVIPINDKEMSFFLTRNYGTPKCYLERMKLRIDGFASLHAKYKEGYVITKPLILKGDSLKMNFSTSSVGYVKVVLLDEKGKELEGFGEKSSIIMRGDKIDEPVLWTNVKSIREIGGKTVRLKFIIRDADIYSFEVR